MAKNLVFSVDLDTSQAEKNIESFMAETVSAKTKLRELQTAAREASVAGNDALANTFAKAAGEVKDAIGDANSAVNNFASDTKKLDVAIGTAQGLAGAFATVQGTMALFGADNEKLQKTLTKVQGSMAVLNGVQQVANTLNKESAVGAKLYAASNAILNSSLVTSITALKGFRLALVSTGIGAIAVALGMLIANFDDFKKVIMNLIPGLGAIADFMSKIGTAVSDYLGFTSDASRATEKLAKSTARSSEDIEAQIAILEAQGGKEKEIYELRKKQINNELALMRQRLKEKGNLTDEEWKQFRALKNQILVLDEAEKKRVADNKKKEADEDKKDKEDAQKRQEDHLKKLNDIRVANKNRELSLIKDEGERAIKQFEFQREEQRKVAKKNGEDLLLFDAETAKLRQELQDKLNTEAIKKREEAGKKNLELIKLQAEADGKVTMEEFDKIQAIELANLDQALKDKTISQEEYDARIIALNTARNEKIKSDNKTALADEKDQLDKRLENLDLRYQLEDLKGQANSETLRARAAEQTAIFQEQLDKGLISQEEFNLKKAQLEESVTAKEKEENDKRREDRQKLNDFVVQSTLSSLSFLSDMNELFGSKNKANAKKAFENNKKIQIAETLIQTYAAAQAVFANAAANPATILFPAQPYIQAGIAIASGLAKVAKIKSTTFEGGGGGDNAPAAAGAGPGTIPTPQNPFVNQPASGVIRPTGTTQQQQSQRVYVLETDITTTQKRVAVIENNSNAVF